MRGYWSAFWFFFASKLLKQFFFSLEFGISILPLKGDFSIFCVNIFRRVRFWVSICRAMHFTQLLRQIANVFRSLYMYCFELYNFFCMSLTRCRVAVVAMRNNLSLMPSSENLSHDLGE